MAKKTLTPEQAEIKAMKKEKSSQNWTKFWAIVLAAALTLGVVALGKNQAQTAIDAAADANNNAVVDGNNTVDNSDDDGSMFDDDTSNDDASNDDASNNDASNNDASNNDASNNNSSNNSSSNNSSSNNNSTQENKGPTAADVAKTLNDVTAKAAKGSYNINRTGKFTKSIDVGSITSFLNTVITGVDPNASLDSVVGGFLGVNKPVEAVVTNGAGEGFDGKYMIKAMTLTADDIQDFRVNGNTYQVQIKNTTNPDENSAWAHASNDYITYAEVNESIAGALGNSNTVKIEESGSQANYKKILITAEIVDGKLTKLSYSYTFDATIAIKVIIGTATGTGAAEINGEYSNIKY